MHYFSFETVIGPITILIENDKIIRINFGIKEYPYPYIVNDLTFNIENKIKKFLSGDIKTIDVDYDLIATGFQKDVLVATLKIPYGKTRSYKDIAVEIGRPKAARAIGHALGSNPLPLLIPCHRVIGSSGKMVGFTGGLNIKKYLLSIEQK